MNLRVIGRLLLAVSFVPTLAVASESVNDCKSLQPPPCTDCVWFCQHVPVGAEPGYPLPNDRPPTGEQYVNHFFNLVAEQDFDRWGSLKGFETAVYKNGKRTYDMAITNFGVTYRADIKKWRVKFTMRDRNGDRIEDNNYVVTAMLHFMEGK
jgi:hypothetical protein